MIDVLATEAHFVDHLGAVFGALPPEARGAFMASREASARVRTVGFEPVTPRASNNTTLVASYGDLVRASRAFAGRRKLAIMEHGAGQSYGGRGGSNHGSYAGGINRDAAGLFLHPGPHPAARDRRAYPRARVEVVGSPHLDTLPRKEGPPGRVVAFTFHFNGPICPETRTAYPHFFPAIAALAKRYQLIGTGHPRLWDMGHPRSGLEARYRAAGIEPVRDFAEVCRRADVLIFDNTSAGFAFASTGRSVVVMNSPRYDRRVNHGLRFDPSAGCPITAGLHFCGASHVGVNCDDPANLAACIDEALADPPERRAAREAALDMVYDRRPGASQRAADVLMDWAS